MCLREIENAKFPRDTCSLFITVSDQSPPWLSSSTITTGLALTSEVSDCQESSQQTQTQGEAQQVCNVGFYAIVGSTGLTLLLMTLD